LPILESPDWYKSIHLLSLHETSLCNHRKTDRMLDMTALDKAASELEIKALNEVFAAGFVNRDAKKRASIWTEDGTLGPPTGGFFRGRAAVEKDFETEVGAVTPTSSMEFSNYQFDFHGQDMAFVDVDITIKDVRGPDGIVRKELPVAVFMVAVRRQGKWGVRVERAHFR
jgi:uncharacterized protein (TIGR02246 family)